jgi:hypothetical protein
MEGGGEWEGKIWVFKSGMNGSLSEIMDNGRQISLSSASSKVHVESGK